MSTHALVLSADTDYGSRVLGWLGRYAPGSRIVTRWSQARALLARAELARDDAPVVIFDADRPIADAQRVLAEAHQSDSRVIVLAHGLDSEHWLQYIQAGAFDVLVTPVDPAQLRQAVAAAGRSGGSAYSGWRQWLRQWLRGE